MFSTALMISSLCISAPVLGEVPRELNAMNVAIEIEDFARRQNVDPSKLVIAEFSKLLVENSVKLNVSLLVNTSICPTERSGFVGLNLYLDVLATTFKVVVISQMDNYLLLRELPYEDPFQNFRHNCLLHISIEQYKRANNLVNTLSWFKDGTRRFHCVHRFDHLVFWSQRATLDSCSLDSEPCTVDSLRPERKVLSGDLHANLRISVTCNETKIGAAFTLTSRRVSTGEWRNKILYSVSEVDVMECNSFIRRRLTDVSALLESFTFEVWALVLLTLFILVRFMSWLKLADFMSILSSLSMSFIVAIEVQLRLRHYSHVALSASVLALCFFVGHIYNNFTLSSFLNTEDRYVCTAYVNCRLDLLCYSPIFLRRQLVVENCLCNLNEKQRLLAGKPLQRVVFGREKLPYDVLERKDVFFMERKWEKLEPSSKGQLILLLIRMSSFLSRLFHHGLASIERLRPSSGEINKYRRTSVLYRRQRRHKDSIAYYWGLFVDHDTNRDQFDEESFRKIFPLFTACAIAILAVLICENAILLRTKMSQERLQQARSELFSEVVHRVSASVLECIRGHTEEPGGGGDPPADDRLAEVGGLQGEGTSAGDRIFVRPVGIVVTESLSEQAEQTEGD